MSVVILWIIGWTCRNQRQLIHVSASKEKVTDRGCYLFKGVFGLTPSHHLPENLKRARSDISVTAAEETPNIQQTRLMNFYHFDATRSEIWIPSAWIYRWRRTLLVKLDMECRCVLFWFLPYRHDTVTSILVAGTLVLRGSNSPIDAIISTHDAKKGDLISDSGIVIAVNP